MSTKKSKNLEPNDTMKIQDSKHLSSNSKLEKGITKANEMKKISSLITERLRNKEIKWSKDGTTLEGDLNFNFD